MDSTAADNLISSIRSSYDALKGSVGVHWYTTSAQDQVTADVLALGPRIDDWATTRRGWASAGQEPDGTPYGWDSWVSLSSDLADAINQFGPYFNDGSAIQAAKDAAAASTDELVTRAEGAAQAIGNLALSPWVWWVGGGLLVVLVAGPYLIPMARRLGKAVAS